MKLDKHGWGLAELLIMSSILFILLLIVTYYIYIFYNQLDANDGTQYYNLEARLKTAAVLYAKNRNSSNGDVSLHDLKKAGYIDSFTDKNDYDCNGYVIYNGDRFDSYIRCPNFTSENYNRKYE